MVTRFALITITMSLAGTACAENSLYTDLDADHNGVISQKEASVLPGLGEKWDELDVNADGELDLAEFAKLEMMETVPPAKAD